MSQTTLNERTAKLDHYLQSQMRKTGNQVRLIDLFTCCMKLFAGVLAGLFLLAVIDGWVFELSGWARWGSLFLLLGGAVAYTVLSIVPLLIRKINPVYAAQVVESAQPNMKNSLINYLLLRQQPGKVSRRVVEIVGSRAANDISGVPVENTVDKSHTIKAALILTMMVIVLGAYKVFSPKDPFQTFARILAPSSDISKPARVSISEVTPGNTEVFFGQQLQVSAFISGTFDPESARVIFSTLDGQIVDGSIRMEKQNNNLYSCQLKTGERGIEQSLRYRIVAGDGMSNEYEVTMTSSPILTVESIHYLPAEYMELSEYTDQGVTTIKHYEGTEVTINAIANADIRSCYMQLLREQDGKYIAVKKVSMEKIDDRHARGRLKLQLNANRDGQSYTHYQMHLITNDGGRSRPVAANRIIVNPDMAPTIFVDDPQETELEVPVNSRIRFDLSAHDVDFKLGEVVVVVENDSRRLAEQSLELGEQNLAQPVSIAYEMWPKKIFLEAGDTAYLQFAAFDNREPQANMTLSDQFVIKITDPVENPPKENSPQENQPGDSGEQENQNNADGEGEEDQQQNQPGDQGQTGESEETGSQGSSQDGSQTEDSQTGEGQEGQDGEGSRGDGQSSGQSGSEGQEGSESSGENQAEGQGSQDGSTGEGEQAADQSDQTGGNETGNSSGQDSGEAGSSNSPSGQSGNEQSGSDSAAENDGQPLGDDAHESDIFEEILKHREEQQKNASQSENQSGGQDQTGEQNPDQQNPDQQASGNQSEEGLGQSGQDQAQAGSEQSGSDQSQAGNQAESGNQSQAGNEAQSGNQSQGNQSQGNQSQAGNEAQSGNQSQGSQSQGSQSQQSGQQSEPDAGQSSQEGQSGQSPQTDDNGMNQQGQSDSQSNNEGSSQQESGNSGQSQQNQNDQQGQSGSGQQSSESGEQSQEQQSSGGGGQDQQDDQQQQQQQSGGSGQQEQSGSSGGGQEQGESGQSGQSGQQGQEGQQGQSGQQGQQGQQGQSGSGNSESDQPGSQGDQSSGSGQSGSGSDSEGQQSQESSSSQNGSQEGQQSGSSSEQGQQSGSQEGSQQNQGQQGSQSGQGQQGQQGTGEQSGSQQAGGQSTEGSQGQSGQQAGQGQPSDSQGQSGQQQGTQSASDQAGGNSPGSGSSSNNTSGGRSGMDGPVGEGTSADEANLEYTKKATDLALEYLEDQQIDPDPKLLDRLNWTEDDLKDFVKRWKELKRQADSGDARKKREWEQTLKSLGMGDVQVEKQQFQGESDDQQGYREDGSVGGPPPGFADRMKAYSRKRNQVRDE